ncbi:uncharacterized protein LACBIDRAFT_192705 [Laccaria bicolor S238N-H82]|uniref:Predicted protein n=1 Tax=Laccaria bicolor (strain S238N-H82 / ATCC MYA-4686) TaxID=486041 RepID=B0DKZ4_LACBS|nr:uncharacterized protein LACBIDRAFT_192705 [Laccaria bicolor S238N-H82]EDR04823.1 predicted protein [Laccaria bicolor S238N-H82]|eukprot:XP_001884647.1 predicted protein [Laccaria bicolor S238N-H82]
MTLVAIRSVASPDHYVGLDANYLHEFKPSGGGQVKTQTYVASYETFSLERNDDGTVSFKSTAFNDTYIRLDGTDVPEGTLIAPGGGVVNGQHTAHSWEKFRIRQKESEFHQYKAVVGIESAAFPGRYLRLDAHKGIVNVQGVSKSLEEFEILVVG